MPQQLAEILEALQVRPQEQVLERRRHIWAMAALEEVAQTVRLAFITAALVALAFAAEAVAVVVVLEPALTA